MSERRITGGGSSMKKRTVDNVRTGSSPPPSKKLNKRSMTSQVAVPSYQLNDLVLEAIKCHLPPMEGVFFEPLSGRFASITVKRRLSLRATALGNSHSPAVFQLIIKDKKGRTITIVGQENDFASLSLLVLSRIHKCKRVTIWASFTASDKRRGKLLMKSLLEAAVGNDMTDVRRIEYLVARGYNSDSLTAWISQISPSLRHLRIDYWLNSSVSAQQHADILAAAIGQCDRLQSVYLRDPDLPSVWASLLDAICARPKLNALGVYRTVSASFVPPLFKNCIDLDGITFNFWSENNVIGLPSMKQFLARIDTFNFWLMECNGEFYFPQLYFHNVDRVEQMVSSLRKSPLAPPLVAVRMRSPYADRLPWEPETLNSWLLIASRHQVQIKIFCRPEFPLPTVQQFLAIKEAIEAATIPGLLPLPVHDPQHITFTFVSGAEVRLLLE